MEPLIVGLRYAHIVIGFVGLAAYWIPVLTKKGGVQHVRFGKVFALCGYIVATTAIMTTTLRFSRALWEGVSIRDNVEGLGFLLFLFYLGWVTLGLVHHAVRTIRTRRDPDSIATPFHIALGVIPAVGSVLVIAWALAFWSPVSIILLALSPVGFLTGKQILEYVFRRPPEKMAWFYAHMNAMLGAGIAFHTAFLVFGSRIVLDLTILGDFNWVPWILPGVIGTIAGAVWEKRYRRKFGDLPAAAATSRA